MFESRISAGATEKITGWQKPHAQTVAWSYDMGGHAQKCVERYCELANKKVSSPCLDDHQFKQEELTYCLREAAARQCQTIERNILY